METIVTRSLGRHLLIGFFLAMIEVEIGGEGLAGAIIEVVLRVKAMVRIVTFAQVFYVLGLGDTLVLASHMVGHEVDYHLQPCTVRAVHQLFKLLHALRHVHG